MRTLQQTKFDLGANTTDCQSSSSSSSSSSSMGSDIIRAPTGLSLQDYLHFNPPAKPSYRTTLSLFPFLFSLLSAVLLAAACTITAGPPLRYHTTKGAPRRPCGGAGTHTLCFSHCAIPT